MGARQDGFLAGLICGFEDRSEDDDPVDRGIGDLVREHPQLVARELVVRFNEAVEDLKNGVRSYSVRARARFDDDEGCVDLVWCHRNSVPQLVSGVRAGVRLLTAIFLPHTTDRRPRWTRDGGNGGC